MKKAQFPQMAELDLGDTKDSTATKSEKLAVIDDPKTMEEIIADLGLSAKQLRNIESLSQHFLTAASVWDIVEDSSATKPTKPRLLMKNPRALRVLTELQHGPVRRKRVDAIAGASNGPDVIFQLREKGLEIPCQRVPGIDCDGRAVRSGVYTLTNADKRKLKELVNYGLDI